MDKKLLAFAIAAAVFVGGCIFAIGRARSENPTVAVRDTQAVQGTVVTEKSTFAQTMQNISEIVTETAQTEATYPVSQYREPEEDTAGETTAAKKKSASVTTAATTATDTTAKTTAKATAETTAKTTAKTTTKATTQATTKSNVKTSSGTLPKDMTLTGLYRKGYDVIGQKQYIFNDDKNATQSKFGYNRFYDSAAGLLDFHIDTCRMAFKNYGGKDWMIQLWKGTYITGEIGTVGCEIGLYNRTAGKYGGLFDHYSCAKEADWLNMEMTMLWDENEGGAYKAQFTRTYGKYWWPTGFVDGQLTNTADTSGIRVLGRITFKDEDMAKLFENSLASTGFTSVSTFNPDKKDTYRRYICDVIFCWQDARD